MASLRGPTAVDCQINAEPQALNPSMIRILALVYANAAHYDPMVLHISEFSAFEGGRGEGGRSRMPVDWCLTTSGCHVASGGMITSQAFR